MELPIPGISVISKNSLDRSVYNTLNPSLPANEQESLSGVATRDVVVDEQLGIWVRIFLPTTHLQDAPKKLPIILYFHGGGFIFLSPASKPFHWICTSISSRLQVIVISLDYRLAPEHRLPAAFDDACTCFNWLQSQARAQARSLPLPGEPWLIQHADFSNCTIMGHSAGATIAQQLCSRLPSLINVDENLVRVKGLVSCIPGFIGSRATASEERLAARDKHLTLDCLRACYTFGLPEDATLDHPFGDPRGLQLSRSSFPPVLLVVGDEDLLIDRQLEFAEYLEESGVKVIRAVYKGLAHADMMFPEILGKEESSYSLMQEFITNPYTTQQAENNL